MNFLKPMGHDTRGTVIVRPTQRHKRLLIQRMSILPVPHGLEIATPVLDIEIGKRVVQGIRPEMRVYVRVRVAEDVLQEQVHAVREMQAMDRRRVVESPRVFVSVVVLEIRLPAQTVQAVDLVKDVDPARVHVRSQPPALRETYHLLRIFADGEHLLARQWDRPRVAQLSPCAVDLVARFLAEDAQGGGLEERGVHAFGLDFDFDVV